MKNIFILRFLDLFSSIYKYFGIDYTIMRLILNTKLIIDFRKLENEEQKNNNTLNPFMINLIGYVVMGLLITPIIISDINITIKMSIYFSFFMIMILTLLISDFSYALLDIEDREILAIKGIDLKTLNAAKITHVFIYMSIFSFALSLFSLISMFRYGIKYVVLLIGSILLINLFMLIITVTVYLLLLKLFKGEKLKDMINIFQVIFLITTIVGYQFIFGSINTDSAQIIYNYDVWNVLFPPMWFASNFNIIENGINSNIELVMLIMSIVVPIISLVLYIKLMPIFEDNLYKLHSEENIKNKKNIKRYKKKLNEEKIIYNFIYKLMKKDREFISAILPNIALAIVMPIMFIISIRINKMEISSESLLFLLGYLSIFFIQNVILISPYSTNSQGSWIYEILPIKNKNNMHKAMIKISIYKYLTPVFLVISAIFIYIQGKEIIIDLVIMYMNGALITILSYIISGKKIAFTIEKTAINGGKNMLTLLKIMFTATIIISLHSGMIIFDSNLIKGIYLGLLVISIVLIDKRVFK